MAIEFIRPDWHVPDNVRAVSSARAGGLSAGAFSSLNLGDHVGDEPARVAANRALLREQLQLPAEPTWLVQVHGCDVAAARSDDGLAPLRADAAVASRPGLVCAVMTADCLPALFCDEQGLVVAAAHAGWRGLLNGVLEATASRMGCPPERIIAWLGPAIGPAAFAVGGEVRDAFCYHSGEAEEAFVLGEDERWRADLYTLARQRLAAAGVGRVSGGDCCTFSDRERFFSYRRDGRTGRMASLIWLD
ncbi:MAG: peptidoglycan editing factor PgeF [Thiohalocapsa sp.]